MRVLMTAEPEEPVWRVPRHSVLSGELKDEYKPVDGSAIQTSTLAPGRALQVVVLTATSIDNDLVGA